MGTSYQFKCPSCGYSAQSSGQLDWGLMDTVEPYICSKCQQLTDVLVGEHGNVRPKESLSEKEKRKYYVCGECRSRKITKWDTEKRPCPKCGSSMVKDEHSLQDWD